MFETVLGHTSVVGHTGYANHARNFFTALNNHVPVRIRNFAHYPTLDNMTPSQQDMVIHQNWSEPPYNVGTPFTRNPTTEYVNIILMETNHYYFYDKYEGPVIGYNVWESTRQPDGFFKKMLELDQFWVPTEWQRRVTIEQGYPESKIRVVPEAVDGTIFFPVDNPEPYDDGRFKFIIFGRWDYRKFTTEMIQSFVKTFGPEEPVDLIISVDNKFPVDGMKTTADRLEYHNIQDSRIKNVGFVTNEQYVDYLQRGHCLLSCSRAEGWNLPLIEAIACGIPTISSAHEAQLEFAQDASVIVRTKEYRKPQNVFMSDDTPGLWDEPDFDDLCDKMRYVYENYSTLRSKSLVDSELVRNKFTWENAGNLGWKYLQEFYWLYYGKRLNVGCGSTKKIGYINIDLVESQSTDLVCSTTELPYQTVTIDSITSIHALEHFGKCEVPVVLNEWYRVLKDQGSVDLEVPDLEWCVKNWLENKSDEWALDTIFGNQNHVGEFHKTGFTKTSITKALELAGFTNIQINDVWSHDQNSYSIKASKDEGLVSDDCFILDCYTDTPEKVEMLKNQISALKRFSKPIILVCHLLPPSDVIVLVDHIVYDSNNLMSEDYKLTNWNVTPKYLKVISSYEQQYHGAAVYTSLKNGVDFVAGKYKYAHFIEYDTVIDVEKYIRLVSKELKRSKKFVGYYYRPVEQDSLTTNLFSFDVDWMKSRLIPVKTWQDYRNLESLMVPGSRFDYILEFWLYLLFQIKGLEDVRLFPFEERNLINFDNLVDQGYMEPKVKFLVSETDKNELVLFAMNESPDTYTINMKIFEGDRIVDDLLAGDVWHHVVPKRSGTIECSTPGVTKTFQIDTTRTYDQCVFRFYDDRIKCIRWHDSDNHNFKETEDDFNVTFHGGARLEIKGTSSKTYDTFFKDGDITIHRSLGLKPNHWSATSRKYHGDWTVSVESDGVEVFKESFDAKGKNVLIYTDSQSLGDTVAWAPYAEEYRKKWDCNVYLATHWNNLLDYPKLNLVPPGTKVDNCYAVYEIGCRDGNSNKNHWRSINLQQIATDYLGLDFKEIRPNIKRVTGKSPVEKPYVVISEFSTLQCKLWNFPNGWQILVDQLKKKGMEVVSISKEPTNLRNVVKRNGHSIEETIQCLQDSLFFIGVSSGLAWLAWAIGVPVVMISGVTKPMHEFKCHRVHNDQVCSGCWNDIDVKVNLGNWMFCPHQKNFECSRSITPENLLSAINGANFP